MFLRQKIALIMNFHFDGVHHRYNTFRSLIFTPKNYDKFLQMIFPSLWAWTSVDIRSYLGVTGKGN